jgi:internalin A
MLTMSALISALALAPGVANAAPNSPVTVKDPVFRTCLTTATAGAPLTQASLAAITGEFTCQGVSDITGVQYLTGISGLSLSGAGKLASLSPLASLSSSNLTSIYIATANATSLPTLSKLPALTRLHVIRSRLAEVPNISKLPSLTYLRLGNNWISSASSSALKSSSLKDLNLEMNKLKLMPSLAGLTSIERVSVFGNNITKISASALRSSTLRDLQIGLNPVTAIPDVSGLTALEELGAVTNGLILDLTPLNKAIKARSSDQYVLRLDFLEMDRTVLPNAVVGKPYTMPFKGLDGHSLVIDPAAGEDEYFEIEPVSESGVAPIINWAKHQVTYTEPGLYMIHIPDEDLREQTDGKLSNGAGLDEMILQYVIPSGRSRTVKIPDIHFQTCLSMAAGGQELTQPVLASISGALNCSEWGISDISGVQYLTGVSYISLYENRISSLSPLESLRSSNLIEIDVSNNMVGSVPNLSKLTALTKLNVRWNKVTSVPSLSQWPSIKELYLSDNLIKSASARALKSNTLEVLDLSYNPLGSAVPTTGLPNLRTLTVS